MCLHLYEMSRKDISIQKEQWLPEARVGVETLEENIWGDSEVLTLDRGDDVQLYIFLKFNESYGHHGLTLWYINYTSNCKFF